MKVIKGLHVSGSTDILIPIVGMDEPMRHTIKEYSDENGVLLSEHNFSPDTIKLLIEHGNMVTSYAIDITTIGLPDEGSFSIVEVEIDELPSGFTEGRNFMNWELSDTGLVSRKLSRDERIFMNTQKRDSLTAYVISELMKLQVFEKHGVLSEENAKKLKKLELGLIALSSIDVEDEDIQWPDL